MIRFIDVLGKTLPKPRIRELCKAVELSDLESRLMLCRCCDALGYDQIADLHYISANQQKALLPGLNSKVELWLHLNPDFLVDKEFNALNQALKKYLPT